MFGTEKLGSIYIRYQCTQPLLSDAVTLFNIKTRPESRRVAADVAEDSLGPIQFQKGNIREANLLASNGAPA